MSSRAIYYVLKTIFKTFVYLFRIISGTDGAILTGFSLEDVIKGNLYYFCFRNKVGLREHKIKINEKLNNIRLKNIKTAGNTAERY